MFAIVPRSVYVSEWTPGPVNSKMQPRRPRSPRRRSSSRITSFAWIHGRGSSFSRKTPTIFGHGSSNGCPAMQTATSSPPAPIAIIAQEPDCVVCESAPTSVCPGFAKRSQCT